MKKAAETVNLAEAAQRLGMSDKSVRKRLSPRFKHEDRIRGAVKEGRDWKIPVSEINRLLDSSFQQLGPPAYALLVTTNSLLALAKASRERLAAAARGYVDLLDAAGNGDVSAPADAFRELQEAVREEEDVRAAAKLVHAIRRGVRTTPWFTR